MLPFITIAGVTLPTYGILAVSGALLGLGVALLQCPRRKLSREDCAYLYVFGALGALLGAKILYLLTAVPQLTEDLAKIGEGSMTGSAFAEKYLFSGMVFYGGLGGALLGSTGCARYFGLRLRDYFSVLLPALSLIHGIGRIGCFCIGCCYGVPAEWGVTYTRSPIAPNGVPLVPVQLIEAGSVLLLGAFLLVLAWKEVSWSGLLGCYLALYGPLRFFLEFWRGDLYRGMGWGLSTSQWMSIPVLLTGLALLLHWRKTGKKRTADAISWEKSHPREAVQKV